MDFAGDSDGEVDRPAVAGGEGPGCGWGDCGGPELEALRARFMREEDLSFAAGCEDGLVVGLDYEYGGVEEAEDADLDCGRHLGEKAGR